MFNKRVPSHPAAPEAEQRRLRTPSQLTLSCTISSRLMPARHLLFLHLLPYLSDHRFVPDGPLENRHLPFQAKVSVSIQSNQEFLNNIVNGKMETPQGTPPRATNVWCNGCGLWSILGLTVSGLSVG
jgi:hypothetical protein